MWTQKYKPVKCSELIGNNKSIEMIKKWLNNFYKINSKKNLVVTGYHGIGKTTTIYLLLKEMGYNIQKLDFKKIKNKQIKEYIDSLKKGIDISKVMNGEENKKNTIVIDEIENITSTNEKKFIENLRKENEKNCYMPIIFISNTSHTKFLLKLKTNCLPVNFNKPCENDLQKIMDTIINKENIELYNINVKKDIIKYVNGDIRKLINILQDLYLSNKKKKNIIDNKIWKIYKENSEIKNLDLDLFKSADYLFNKYRSINKCLTLYEIEKSKLPLMIHEHYYNHIINNFNDNKKLDILKNVSEDLSYGDYIEYHVYNDQDWDMQEYHGFYSCSATSFYLNSKEKKCIKDSLKFPQDLHKTSIKNINKKNISNIKYWFKNATSYDYIQMNRIIKSLLKKKDIKEIGKIFKSYNIDISQIESLLKIDKILRTKNDGLTTKTKKELKKYL